MLLDLFCGGGGAGTGYHRAGFRVVGVDIAHQPDYPYTFHQGDAFTLLPDLIRAYRPVAIHASPPCQHASTVSHLSNRYRQVADIPNLIPPTRAALVEAGLPYVMENVNTTAAGLCGALVLCGQMFGLPIYRHRGFETSLPWLTRPPHPRHQHRTARGGQLPHAGRPLMSIHGRNGHHSTAWVRAAAAAMGVPWITGLNAVCEAIPPAYTPPTWAHYSSTTPPHSTGRQHE